MVWTMLAVQSTVRAIFSIRTVLKKRDSSLRYYKIYLKMIYITVFRNTFYYIFGPPRKPLVSFYKILLSLGLKLFKGCSPSVVATFQGVFYEEMK